MEIEKRRETVKRCQTNKNKNRELPKRPIKWSERRLYKALVPSTYIKATF